jgi:quaternary ammonium compound-resistance protein SugE
VAWVLVVVAGLFETAFAVSLKNPVGTAYAVWTGIGAAGTAVIGMWLLGDPVGTLRILSIVLIVAGVIGLNLAPSSAH